MTLVILTLFAYWLAQRVTSPDAADVRARHASGSVIGWSSVHEQGDDHLLKRSRHAGRDPRGGPGRRDLHRARATARRGWQHLQGPGLESAPRHAILVC